MPQYSVAKQTRLLPVSVEEIGRLEQLAPANFVL